MKNMKNHLFLYLLLIFTIIFVAGCATNVPQIPSENNLQSSKIDQENNQYESTGVPRVVLIELFNTQDCPASKAINPIIEEIAAEYENTEVILVELAGWGKYATEETNQRFKWYFSDKSRLTAPAVCFNGLNQSFSQGFSSGGGSNETTEEEPPTTTTTTTEEEPPTTKDAILPQEYGSGDGTKTNPWTGIQDAIKACPSGGTVYLSAGYYQLSGECVINKDNLTIMGAGIGKTIVLTGDAHGFSWDGGRDYITIRDLTIDGSAQASTSRFYGIYPANSDYATVKNVEVKNCSYSGINNYQTNHGLYENLLLHSNGEHGMHPCSNSAGRNMYNTYRNIDAYDNVWFGFSDRGTGKGIANDACYNVFDNINAWGNGSNGIQVAYQNNATIQNCTVYDNGRHGFRFAGIQDSTIDNCVAIGNGVESTTRYPGIVLYSSSTHATYRISNVTLTNCIVKNTVGYVGVLINGADDVTFDSCQFYDDQPAMTQTYGLRLVGDDYGTITLKNCTLTPNKDGDIYNPNKVALDITTDQMLASLYSL